MLKPGTTIDNRTLCDMFSVANMGGIRVSRSRNLIVLVSNHTDPTYRNDWQADVLHFIGMGSVGPQKLDRQNKTLANSKRNGMAVHLFEVHEKSKYVYAGGVELADEPYLSDQPDARADSRFVWMFPLRKKPSVVGADAPVSETGVDCDFLPHGAYAVIKSDLTDRQAALVHDALDRLKETGIGVFDQRDVDRMRYEKASASWHEAVLDRVRATVRELIASRKRLAKAQNRKFELVDDELRINSASTEQELRAALALLDRDDPVSANEIFDNAMSSVPMPDAPATMKETDDTDEPVIVRKATSDPSDLRISPSRGQQAFLPTNELTSRQLPSPSLRSGAPFGRRRSLVDLDRHGITIAIRAVTAEDITLLLSKMIRAYYGFRYHRIREIIPGRDRQCGETA